jgi:hypothetical protein
MPPDSNPRFHDLIDSMSFMRDTLVVVQGWRGHARESGLPTFTPEEQRGAEIAALHEALPLLKMKARLCVALTIDSAAADPTAEELAAIGIAGVRMLPHSACQDSLEGDSWLSFAEPVHPFVRQDTARVWSRAWTAPPKRWNANEGFIEITVSEDANTGHRVRCRVERVGSKWTIARCGSVAQLYS